MYQYFKPDKLRVSKLGYVILVFAGKKYEDNWWSPYRPGEPGQPLHCSEGPGLVSSQDTVMEAHRYSTYSYTTKLNNYTCSYMIFMYNAADLDIVGS